MDTHTDNNYEQIREIPRLDSALCNGSICSGIHCFKSWGTDQRAVDCGGVGLYLSRDRKHLAQDGMLVVCVNLSSQDGSILSGPDIISRGFVYVKESETLMEDLRMIAMDSLDRCRKKGVRDWATIKSAIKSDLSGYLFKSTKRNPMILPVIMEI